MAKETFQKGAVRGGDRHPARAVSTKDKSEIKTRKHKGAEKRPSSKKHQRKGGKGSRYFGRRDAKKTKGRGKGVYRTHAGSGRRRSKKALAEKGVPPQKGGGAHKRREKKKAKAPKMGGGGKERESYIIARKKTFTGVMEKGKGGGALQQQSRQ